MATKQTFFFGLFLMAITVSNAQTTWVADNNFNAPTGPNVFATIQEAVDAASPGDIIQVQPSPTTYGSVTINKSDLTLIGIGFNVDKDIPLGSTMGNIVLTNNADGTSQADNTTIKGLKFGIFYPGSVTGPSYTLLNAKVENCQFSYLYINSNYANLDGLEVRGCYLTGISPYGSNLEIRRFTTNVLLRNNLFSYSLAFYSSTPASIIITNNIVYDGIYINAEGTSTSILNNNFIASSGGDAAFLTKIKDAIVANNIFFGMTPSIANAGSTSSAFERNVFTNNLVYSTGDDTMPPTGGGAGNSGSGNIVGSPLFTNAQLLNTWSSAYDYTLQAGSPALSAGSDGTDIGISGGAYPFTDPNFVLKTSHVPVIQILNTSTVINPGDDLPVRIKANSN